MKVLMVNSNLNKLPIPTIPFGLCFVSASLEKAGHSVKVLDLTFSTNTIKDIENTINDFSPGIIGISIRNIDAVSRINSFFYLDPVKDKVIEPIKKVFPGPIVIGGTAVGIGGAEMLHFFDLEYAIIGDGEEAMVEFINRVTKNLPMHGCPGLTWRKNGQIIEENPPLRVSDLNALPSANPQRYIDLKAYRRFNAPIQVQTKRGCALECTYCTYRLIEGAHYRLRDPELIANEIETVVKESGIHHFEFSDSTFNLPLDHSKAILKAIINRNLKLDLRTMGLNPKAIDEEYVDLLAKAGFKDVEVGVEAGNDLILKALGKNFTKQDILRAGELLHRIGIPVKWYLIAGAPGETIETLTETFQTITGVIGVWDLVVVFNSIRAYKGSIISRQMTEQNSACTTDNFLHPVFYEPQGISLDDIRIFNKRMGLLHPNLIFPEERQRVPDIILNIQNTLMRLFAPNKPWYMFHIFMHKVQKKLGINFIRRKILEFKNPHIFRKKG